MCLAEPTLLWINFVRTPCHFFKLLVFKEKRRTSYIISWNLHLGVTSRTKTRCLGEWKSGICTLISSAERSLWRVAVILLLTNCRERSPSWKADSSSSSQETPAFDGTRRFITMFTRACHCYVSWARWIQSTSSHYIYLRSTFVLSSHLGISVTVTTSGLPTKILYAFLVSPTCHMPPSTLSSFSLSRPSVEEYKSLCV